MQTEIAGWHDTHRITVRLTDADPAPQRYARKGLQYQPRTAYITWDRGSDDDTWRFGHAEVHGARVKFDGTLSKMPEYQAVYERWDQGDLPTWLQKIVSENTPTSEEK